VTLPAREDRARSFGEVADDYDRYRPGPPIEAARWVLGADTETVADLGAGTGGLTRSLVQLARRVVALEPDPRMRRVLAAHESGAAVVGALGEALPIASGSLDGVVASSSWHWMDPAVAGAEVARVLRPGGVFGLLWSGPDRGLPWVAELLARPRPRTTTPGDPAEHRRRRTMVLPPDLPFARPESTLIRFSRPFDLDELAGLGGTYSVVILGAGAARTARMSEIRERARRLFGNGPVTVPMVCRCWRTVRLAGSAH
jgi:SAM-dependent methyltransferase